MPLMNPGDRIRNLSTGRLAFVLFESNISDEVMVRFDGRNFNAILAGSEVDRWEVLPAEAFRQDTKRPFITVKYHVLHDKVLGLDGRCTTLTPTTPEWVPSLGVVVDRITVTYS